MGRTGGKRQKNSDTKDSRESVSLVAEGVSKENSVFKSEELSARKGEVKVGGGGDVGEGKRGKRFWRGKLLKAGGGMIGVYPGGRLGVPQDVVYTHDVCE